MKPVFFWPMMAICLGFYFNFAEAQTHALDADRTHAEVIGKNAGQIQIPSVRVGTLRFAHTTLAPIFSGDIA
jgi:hypothetical protein